jgi:glycosyltransferase involved in cell wall biosynthesis
MRGFEALKGGAKTVLRRTSESNAAAPAQPSPSSEAGRAQRSALARALDIVDAALAIPDQESGWLVPAIARGLALGARWRPDVLYSSAPPWTGQLVASALAGALRCPWVADFRDPWGRAPWRGDRFAFAMRASRRLERFVVRRADRILFVSEANRDEFAGHYGAPLAEKFRVVPNGCDASEFDASARPEPLSDPFVLLHAGSLYASRTPLPLLKGIASAVARGIIDPTRFRVRFLGSMALSGREVAQTCEDLGLSGVVEFDGRVPRAESLRAMMSASGLLLLQPGHAVAVPAKLYEYLAAGRPILAIAEGETAAIVRASGAGITAASDDEGAIVLALEQFVRLASQPFNRVPREFYDGDARAAEIGSILAESVTAGGRQPAPQSAPAREAQSLARADQRR